MTQPTTSELNDIMASIAISVFALHDAASKLFAWAGDPVNVADALPVRADAEELVAQASWLEGRLAAIERGKKSLSPPKAERVEKIATLTDEVVLETVRNKRLEHALALADKAFDLGVEAGVIGRA